MRDAILKKLASVTALAADLDLGLWAGRFKSPETKQMASDAKDRLIDKAERCRRVLRVRYGMDVR
jgi:hypothetical protein